MRRKKSKSSLPLVLTAVFALLLALLLAALFFRSGTASSRTLGKNRYAPLDVAQFIETPSSFAGNQYVISGIIDSLLDSSEQGGKITRLLSIESDGGKFLPVLVSEGASSFPLERGQRIVLFCRVDPRGLPVADAIEKR